MKIAVLLKPQRLENGPLLGRTESLFIVTANALASQRMLIMPFTVHFSVSRKTSETFPLMQFYPMTLQGCQGTADHFKTISFHRCPSCAGKVHHCQFFKTVFPPLLSVYLFSFFRSRCPVESSSLSQKTKRCGQITSVFISRRKSSRSSYRVIFFNDCLGLQRASVFQLRGMDGWMTCDFYVLLNSI